MGVLGLAASGEEGTTIQPKSHTGACSTAGAHLSSVMRRVRLPTLLPFSLNLHSVHSTPCMSACKGQAFSPSIVPVLALLAGGLSKGRPCVHQSPQ